jgi:hypothetical protein
MRLPRDHINRLHAVLLVEWGNSPATGYLRLPFLLFMCAVVIIKNAVAYLRLPVALDIALQWRDVTVFLGFASSIVIWELPPIFLQILLESGAYMAIIF